MHKYLFISMYVISHVMLTINVIHPDDIYIVVSVVLVILNTEIHHHLLMCSITPDQCGAAWLLI